MISLIRRVEPSIFVCRLQLAVRNFGFIDAINWFAGSTLLLSHPSIFSLLDDPNITTRTLGLHLWSPTRRSANLQSMLFDVSLMASPARYHKFACIESYSNLQSYWVQQYVHQFTLRFAFLWSERCGLIYPNALCSRRPRSYAWDVRRQSTCLLTTQ